MIAREGDGGSVCSCPSDDCNVRCESRRADITTCATDGEAVVRLCRLASIKQFRTYGGGMQGNLFSFRFEGGKYYFVLS